MAENLFEKIQNLRAVSNIPERGRLAQDWFRQMVQSLFGTRRVRGKEEMLDADNAKLVPSSNSKFLSGRMFMFVYDPKSRMDLPYYDRFPLVLTLEHRGPNLLGLNLHYLPVLARARLFNSLLSFVTDDRYDSRTRIRATYQIIKKLSKLYPAMAIIKEYDIKYIRTRLLEVHPRDWEIALFLPTEAFEKKGKQTVWDDTQKQMEDKKRKQTKAARIQRELEQQQRLSDPFASKKSRTL